MSFAHPEFLFLSPLGAVLAWWWAVRPRPAVRFSDTGLFAGGTGRRARRAVWGGALLRGLACLALVVACAGPRVPDGRTRLPAEAVAVVLVIDVSGSMDDTVAWAAGEPKITQLEAARRAFKLFVAGGRTPDGTTFAPRPSDQIGLVTFAIATETACPLTLNHTVLLKVVDELTVVGGQAAGTNVGDAIALGVIRLERADRVKRRVMILISDGLHSQSFDGFHRPLQAAQLAASLGYKVYTIDAGSGAGRKTLQDVADMTGGKAFDAAAGPDMLAAFKEIDALERVAVESPLYRRYFELYWWFAAAAVVLLLTAHVLDRTRWRVAATRTEIRMFAFFSTSSGLAGFVTDAREFVAGVRFARPDALWLLLLLPLLGLVDRWAAGRRRAAVGRIGRPATVAGQLTHPAARRRWSGLAYPVAWVLLLVGLAGPRWGKSDETGVAIGRDLVIVIDLSRTMLADDVTPPPDGWRLGEAWKVRPDDDDDERKEKERARREPARWRAARQGAHDLLDAVAARGGHRVAVVVFAARAKLLCPLTTDYDHARAVIEEMDAEHRPLDIRPAPADVVSGTRIGRALVAAVEAHDPRFPGSQDIVLISDGDDPGDDREWVRGSDRARDAGIPVHAVGVGNPDANTVLVFGEELIETRLQEGLLKQLAAEARGQYVAARRTPPPLGEFFRERVEPFPSRELTDDTVPQRKERYPWFLAPALALFVLGWLRGR